MKRKLSSVLAALLAVACLFSACQSGPPSISADPEPLSAEEAGKLQKKLAPSGSDAMISMGSWDIERYLSEGWLPVYAQVTGAEEIFESAHGNMDFFRIPLKILHNPNNHYETGQEVALYRNTMFRGLLPELKEGDVFVALMKDCVDVHQDSKDILRVEICNTGCYTITQDGHAIAAYTEYPDFQQNGVGLATLLKEYETLENAVSDS